MRPSILDLRLQLSSLFLFLCRRSTSCSTCLILSTCTCYSPVSTVWRLDTWSSISSVSICASDHSSSKKFYQAHAIQERDRAHTLSFLRDVSVDIDQPHHDMYRWSVDPLRSAWIAFPFFSRPRFELTHTSRVPQVFIERTPSIVSLKLQTSRSSIKMNSILSDASPDYHRVVFVTSR